MLLAEPIKHTDAFSQARFVALTQEQQMLEIWLNTRETNGHVATALSQIADLEKAREKDINDLTHWREDELYPWMTSVDKRLIGAAAVITFILAAAPFVFFALSQWK